MCARCLGVPPEEVFISETSTDKVPNSSPSAASMSTDLYGMAVKVGVVFNVVTIYTARPYYRRMNYNGTCTCKY